MRGLPKATVPFGNEYGEHCTGWQDEAGSEGFGLQLLNALPVPTQAYA